MQAVDLLAPLVLPLLQHSAGEVLILAKAEDVGTTSDRSNFRSEVSALSASSHADTVLVMYERPILHTLR